MAVFYLDTSALVRRYDPREPGADKVRVLCAASADSLILISPITPVEIASALNRKTRLGTITIVERDLIWNEFRQHHRNQYNQADMSEAALRQAEHLTFRYPLRAYDALQIAVALSVRTALVDANPLSLTFITADRAQARAAESEGLQVELID